MSFRFAEEEIEQSIADRFEKQAVAYPDRLAVRSSDTAWTYAELNSRANRLARGIQKTASTAERVVLLFDQGVPVLVAVLAVLKLGKAYVPLDPTSPSARLSELLADAEAGLVLTDDRHYALGEQLARGGSLPLLNADAVEPGSTENLGLHVSPDSTAYMLYTSGSTGRPKGVVQRHRNLLHFVRTYSNNLGITPEDRIAWLHSITFSASNMNVYPALLNGASVFPYDVKSRGVVDLAELLRTERISMTQCVPTVLRHFLASLDGPQRFPALRIFEIAGEPLFRRDVELFRRLVGTDCQLINRLAFTEGSVAAQYFIPPNSEIAGSAIPVGRPVGGMEILVLDEGGGPVAPEQVGEITLRSKHLSPGYWRRPDLTAKAFSSEDEFGKRTYRTGDLGRIRADGLLEYAGRKDFRVKIRGYTIEVAEIEAALLGLGSVQQAVVMAKEDRRGDLRLVAYAVPSAGARPTASELRELLSSRLPDYMIPGAFVLLGQFPVTSTGKLDRLALPAPEDPEEELQGNYTAPRTPTEAALAEIFAEVFRTPRVGIHDDFFALGGHSLLATQVVARVRRNLEVDLPLSALFEFPSIADLAARIEKMVEEQPPEYASRVDPAPL
jgi:amino acid adenylation domain-containing protein